MRYEDLTFKIPVETKSYREDSAFVIKQITNILDTRKQIGDNKIIINTNLKLGLPLENINKIAGPMIEAWAGEVFFGIRDDLNNQYNLINVEAQERLGMADIILQFKKGEQVLTGNVDVKATANDIGIDINPEYIEMSRERLSEKFCGFDSIDERMQRVPNDLNDPQIRLEYIDNHIKWFLKNHPDAIGSFLEEVKNKYGSKLTQEEIIKFFSQTV